MKGSQAIFSRMYMCAAKDILYSAQGPSSKGVPALCLAFQPSLLFPSFFEPLLQAVNLNSTTFFCFHCIRLAPLPCLAEASDDPHLRISSPKARYVRSGASKQILACAFGVRLNRLALRLMVGIAAAWWQHHQNVIYSHLPGRCLHFQYVVA